MKSPFGDSIWSIANTLSTVLGSLVVYLIVSRWLGVEQFGLWALAGASLFLLRFADLGVAGAVMRAAGQIRADVRRQAMRILGWGIGINALGFSICAAVSFFVAPKILATTVDAAHLQRAAALLPYVAFAAFSQLVVACVTNVLVGLRRYRLVYGSGTAVSLVQVLIVLPIILKFGIAGYPLLQAGTNFAQVLFLAIILVRDKDRQSNGAEMISIREFVSFALQFNAVTLITTLMEPAVKILLGRFGTLGLVGTYELVWRLFTQLRTVLVAPLQPLAVSMIHDFKTDRPALLRSYHAMSAFAIAVAMGIAFSGIPAVFVLGFFLKLPVAELGLLIMAVACAVGLAFLGVPAHFMSIAAGDTRPILAGSLAYLVTLGLVAIAAGPVFGGMAVVGATVPASLTSAIALIAMSGKFLAFYPLPPRAELAAHRALALAEMRRWTLLILRRQGGL